jgi:hypothetical protein
VAVVITDASENISSPSSGFLKVIGRHNCVTVESLLISLSIERYCVGTKNIAGGMFPETSVLTGAAQCRVPQDIYHSAGIVLVRMRCLCAADVCAANEGACKLFSSCYNSFVLKWKLHENESLARFQFQVRRMEGCCVGFARSPSLSLLIYTAPVIFEVFTAVIMENGVFWDIKTQFVLHRRHITSPLESIQSMLCKI